MKVKRPSRTVGPADWQRHMNLRLRMEYIVGVEGGWRKRTGRPTTARELERTLQGYPGDI
jgi:hypothetical protein